MTEKVKYVCNNCQYEFDMDVMTEREIEDARQDRRPLQQIVWPRCRQANLRRR